MKNKSMFNVSGIFIIVWGTCGYLSSLSLYGLNKLSFTTTYLIIVALFGFTLIGLIFPGFNKGIISFESLKTNFNEGDVVLLSNNKLIIILNVAAYVFSFPYLIKAITIIQSQGFEALRSYAFVGSTQFASTTVLTVFQNVISPLFIATMIVTAIDVSLNRKAIRGLILTTISVALYTVLFGGRYMLFQTILVFSMAYYINSSTNIVTVLKRNKKAILIIVLALGGMLFVTSRRPSGNLVRSIYIYFCGSYGFLDSLIKDTSFSTMHLGGIASIGCIYDFIINVMTFLFGLSPYHGANYQITQITGPSRIIGDGIRYNSLGTMYTAFIPDFGITFSVIGVLVFALVLCYIQLYFSKRLSYFSFSVFLYGLYSVVNSVLSYSFLSFSVIFLVSFLALFTKRFKFK